MKMTMGIATLAFALSVGAYGQAEGDVVDGSAAAPGSIVTVAKIRLSIDGIDYEWTGGPAPERTGGHTSPATAISFIGFAPGDELSVAELEERCAAARDRLLDSGFFFDARVSVIPPSKYPDRRTVLVELREGFTWRFAGGNAFAMVGEDNARGERASWRAFAGYNLDAFAWREELAFGLPVVFALEASFAHTLGDAFVESLDLDAALELGYRPMPDLTLSLKATAAYSDYSGGSFLSLSPSTLALDATPFYGAGLSIAWRTHRRHEGGFEYRASLDCAATGYLTQADAYGSALARASAVVGFAFLELGLLASCGYSAGLEGASLPYPLLADLWSAQDRSVRSGWDREDLYADRFAFGSFELRLRPLILPLGGIFRLSVSPFGFVDFAYSGRDGALAAYDAYGAGLRLGFENPIFAYFTFAYGWNRDGSGRFTMTGSAGF